MAADFKHAFRRDPDGSLTCIAAVVIHHPQGRIEVARGTRLTRGTVFMGVDLATWLDEQLQQRSVP